MAKERLLSVRQTCERLGLPEKLIRRLIREGKLPVTRIGYNMAVAERDVDRLAARQEK
jgi:excisionase family DNA binding protein